MMQYQGGKERIAAHIVKILQTNRNGRHYWEPFMGGASVLSRMDGPRTGSDAHAGLVAMWQAAVAGWVPPTEVSEQEYKELQARKTEADALVAFVGFGCSFAGKYFGGYARDKRKVAPWAAGQSAAVVRKAAGMAGANLALATYDTWTPENMVIYCDPPYANTCAYAGVAKFDSDRFWATVRRWAQTNDVYVSEYAAPDFAPCVWEKELAKSLRSSHKATEKLFKVQP